MGRYEYYLTRVNLSANRVPPDANEDDEGADKEAAKTEESYELEARERGKEKDVTERRKRWERREREAAKSVEENEDAK